MELQPWSNSVSVDFMSNALWSVASNWLLTEEDLGLYMADAQTVRITVTLFDWIVNKAFVSLCGVHPHATSLCNG